MSVNQLISKSVGKSLLERSLGESLEERSFVIGHWSLVEPESAVVGERIEQGKYGEYFKKIEGFDTLFVNKFQILYYIRNFTAFSAASVLLKKPSGGPKGLIGPPCHGAPGWRRREWDF